MLQEQENVIDNRYTCYQQSNKSCNFVGIMNRKKFKILNRPPFANGELHLGHMVNKILKVCFVSKLTIISENLQTLNIIGIVMDYPLNYK